MPNKYLLLFTLITYSVVVSQSFMYILALKDVQLNLGANAYIELRKLIDLNMNGLFKYVMYVALFSSILLVISTIKNPGSVVFITSAIALVALIIDVVIALKGNIPLNNLISTWSADKYPDDWETVRKQWFAFFQYRQIANIIGFISLAIGAVFGNK